MVFAMERNHHTLYLSPLLFESMGTSVGIFLSWMHLELASLLPQMPFLLNQPWKHPSLLFPPLPTTKLPFLVVMTIQPSVDSTMIVDPWDSVVAMDIQGLALSLEELALPCPLTKELNPNLGGLVYLSQRP
jgi:hypothetical protein